MRVSSLTRETSVLTTKTSPTDIVTAADIEAEKLIRRLLAARCPDSTIIGEELAVEAGDNDVTWIVDPIDGTVNYHLGVPIVSVSIAAAIGNVVVAGAVTDVYRQETFSAVLGDGARLDGAPFEHSPAAGLRQALVITGFSYTASRRGPESEIVARLLPEIRDLRCFGSAAIHLCWVAAGRAHAYFEAELHRYDYAAGALIAREAGATVELPGEESDILIAASPDVHGPLRTIVLGDHDDHSRTGSSAPQPSQQPSRTRLQSQQPSRSQAQHRGGRLVPVTLVAGVDSSTQATKVVLRDIDSGRLVAAATSPHPATSPPVSEQDPAAWWSALAGCFGQMAEHADHIGAISVGAQQHGLVLMSGNEVVRPAKLWNDMTSSAQSKRLIAAAGADWWAAACGSVPVASFTITKLAWFLEHERELAAAVDKVMLPHDYLTWRLTGEHVTDRGDASGTGWFDPSDNEYRSELLAQAVDEPGDWLARLPRVLRHDEPAATVTRTAAAELGLGPGALVGPGSGDNMAAALGLGLRPSDIAVSIGTSGTVYATSDTPTSDSTGTIAGFADATSNFLPLVCTVNAAKVTDAVAGWLGVAPERLSELALAGIDDDLGPVLVPYFDGERTPNLPDATGYWAGLQSGTTREQLALSAFDGVVCGLLEGIEVLRAHGVDTGGRTFLIGGGSQSPAYRRRVADLTGRAIVVPHDKQLVASGAAAQAAAILANEPVQETAQRWALGTGDTVEPQLPAGHATLRSRYRDARDALFPAASRNRGGAATIEPPARF